MWQLEDERLVEHRVQSPLLNVSLLLGDPLVVVKQVDLDIRIGQTRNIHLGEVPCLEYNHRDPIGCRLVA